MSMKKRLAYRTVSYLSATKVLLAFETPFWERENMNIKGGATFTDLNVKQIYYPTWSRNSSKTPFRLFFYPPKASEASEWRCLEISL